MTTYDALLGTISKDGVELELGNGLNFTGAGVTVARNTATGKIDIAIGGGGGSAHAIEDEGVAVAVRPTLNFAGAGVAVTDVGGKTTVTIPGTSDVAPVAYCATGNVTLSGAQTIDNATPTNGDRILVPFQTAAEANGVYVYNSAGAWTRATDFNTAAEFRPGAFFVINGGAIYAKQVATVVTQPAVLGTNPAVFTVSQNIDPVVAGYYAERCGTGIDGDVTFSGVVTLTETKYYRDITVNAGADVRAAGHQMFFSRNLNLTNAPAGWFKSNGGAGGAGGAGTVDVAGTPGIGFNAHEVGGSVSGSAGGQGGINAGSAGTSAADGMNGGGSSNAATGGLGSGGAGGTGGGGKDPAQNYIRIRTWARQFIGYVATAVAVVFGGTGAPGGGGGGGNGATRGGGGGGGGAGGGVLYLSGYNVITGGNTTAGLFQAKGGTGGVGASATNANTGGGAGGSGGPGGFIFFAYVTKTGATIPNAFDVSGGAGANGGDGNGTGEGADGSPGGDGGRVVTYNLTTGASTEAKGGAGAAGTAHAGTTHGNGGAGATFQVNL